MLLNLYKHLIPIKDGIEIAIKTGTSLISTVTLVSGAIGGVIAIINMISDRRHKFLADFITIFSDEDPTRRLGGINGLPRYSKYLFKELFFICCAEENAIIRAMEYDVLQDRSPRKKKQCIQINDFLVDYFLRNDCSSQYLAEREIADTLKSSHTDRRIEYEINHKNNSFLFGGSDNIDSYLLLSSKILAASITKSFHVRLCGNLITQSNMYKAVWVHNSMQNNVFIGNIMRHMYSLSVRYNFCYMRKNNFYNSELHRTRFIDCAMIDILFRDSYFYRTIVQRGSIRKANFDKSPLKKCRFTDVKAITDSSWSGCKITACEYENLKIIRNIMKGTNFVSTKFSDVSLYNNEVIGAFIQCEFENVKWAGSTIKSTQFENCIFKKVDFHGAILSNIKFVGCQFEDTNLEETHSTNIVFDRCTPENITSHNS